MQFDLITFNSKNLCAVVRFVAFSLFLFYKIFVLIGTALNIVMGFKCLIFDSDFQHKNYKNSFFKIIIAKQR